MTKHDFLTALEQLLWDMDENDRTEAIEYYKDYFLDGEVSEEEDVTLRVGSPEKVAARIKVEFTEEHSEYSEQGFEDIRFEERFRTMPEVRKMDGYGEAFENKQEKSEKKTVIKTLGMMVLLLCSLPIILPIGIGVILLAAGIVLGGISLILSLVFGGLSSLFALGLGGTVIGVLLMINGILHLASFPASGLITLGLGGILIAVGILSVLAMIWLIRKAFPWSFHQCKCLFKKINWKKGRIA